MQSIRKYLLKSMCIEKNIAYRRLLSLFHLIDCSFWFNNIHTSRVISWILLFQSSVRTFCKICKARWNFRKFMKVFTVFSSYDPWFWGLFPKLWPNIQVKVFPGFSSIFVLIGWFNVSITFSGCWVEFANSVG
jgi:hypothetical protein